MVKKNGVVSTNNAQSMSQSHNKKLSFLSIIFCNENIVFCISKSNYFRFFP